MGRLTPYSEYIRIREEGELKGAVSKLTNQLKAVNARHARACERVKTLRFRLIPQRYSRLSEMLERKAALRRSIKRLQGAKARLVVQIGSTERKCLSVVGLERRLLKQIAKR